MVLGRLYGVGYGGCKTADDFRKRLAGAPIDLLIDIRLNPRSRFNTDWNGTTHTELTVLEAGIPRYLHLNGLGNINYNNGKAARLGNPQALEFVQEPLEHGVNVAIMCVDKRWQDCHRRLVFREMKKRLPGLEIIHLGQENEQQKLGI